MSASKNSGSRSMIDFDAILNTIGQCNKWQLKNFFALCLTSAAAGLAVVVWLFTAFTPESRCLNPYCDSNSTTSPFYIDDKKEYPGYFKRLFPENDHPKCYYPVVDSSTPYTSCSSYVSAIEEARKNDSPIENVYCNRKSDLLIDSSIVTTSLIRDFDFLCNDEVIYKGLVGSTYMFGMLFGSFFIGLISDSFGRVKALMLSIILISVSGTIGGLVNDPVTFGFLRLITGMGGIGCFMVAFVLCVEYTSFKYTMILGVAIEIPFAIGELILGLEAYLVRDWRTLQMIAHTPIIVLVILYFFLPESPRWLLVNGYRDKAINIIRKAAKTNDKELDESLLENEVVWEQDNQDYGKKEIQHNNASFLDIFKSKEIGLRSLNMFFQWFSVTMCYYGLSFASTDLAGSVYLNFTLTVLVEFPGYIFCLFVMDCWGRRPILSFCQILSGVACIAAGLLTNIEQMAILQIILSLIGKFGASASFAIVYVYTAELFPTSIRNTAIGSCSTMARVGGICALLLVNLKGKIPFVVMGVIAVVAGILAFFFPETVGLTLPETIQDAKDIRKKSKRGFCTCVN